MKLPEWVAEVKEYFGILEGREERAYYDNRATCPCCGSKDRADDDGSWYHDEECPLLNARYFLDQLAAIERANDTD